MALGEVHTRIPWEGRELEILVEYEILAEEPETFFSPYVPASLELSELWVREEGEKRWQEPQGTLLAYLETSKTQARLEALAWEKEENMEP